VETWNNVPNENIIYFYDNQHITGIDAKIPINYKGLAFLGKNTRYRDVAQGIFRMRELGKGQKIKFIISTSIWNSITIESKSLIEKMYNWIINNEIMFLKDKSDLLFVQNLRSLMRYNYDYSTKKDFLDYFNIYNEFNYPEEKIGNMDISFEQRKDLLFNRISHSNLQTLHFISKLNPLFKHLFEGKIIKSSQSKLSTSITSDINRNINFEYLYVISKKHQLTRNLLRERGKIKDVNFSDLLDYIDPSFYISIKEFPFYISSNLVRKMIGYDTYPKYNVIFYNNMLFIVTDYTSLKIQEIMTTKKIIGSTSEEITNKLNKMKVVLLTSCGTILYKHPQITKKDSINAIFMTIYLSKALCQDSYFPRRNYDFIFYADTKIYKIIYDLLSRNPDEDCIKFCNIFNKFVNNRIDLIEFIKIHNNKYITKSHGKYDELILFMTCNGLIPFNINNPYDLE
jgi:hypothetical protein